MTADSASGNDHHHRATAGPFLPVAPVLDIPNCEAMRYYIPLYLKTRDSGDRVREQEVATWYHSASSDRILFLSGLESYATATMQQIFDSQAPDAISRIGHQRLTAPHLNTGEHHPDIIKGYLAATFIVEHDLRRHDHRRYEELFIQCDDNPLVGWGVAAGLADIIVEQARARWGAALQWLDILFYATTGEGNPPAGAINNPTPADDSTRTTGDTSEHRGDPSVRAPAMEALIAGSKQVPSFLCYRDAGASNSQIAVRQWLDTNPSNRAGFLGTLAYVSHFNLTQQHGNDYARDILARGSITNIEGLSQLDGFGLDPVDDLSEGFQLALTVLHHMIDNDMTRADAAVARIQETIGRTWGATITLADLALALQRRHWGNSTEWAHELHAGVTGATNRPIAPLQRTDPSVRQSSRNPSERPTGQRRAQRKPRRPRPTN